MDLSDDDIDVESVETSTEAPKSAPRPKCQAILNGLIRSYKAPRQTEMFKFTKTPVKIAGSGEVQVDHFFEIQHVIKMLFNDGGPFSIANGGEGAAQDENLCSWVVLSVWLNDAQNLYPVKKAFNQYKRMLPLGAYWPGSNQDADIKAYLESSVTSTQRGDQLVWKNLLNRAGSMAMYGNDPGHWNNHRLVAFIGAKICTLMGWKFPKTTGWKDPSQPWR